MGTLTHFRLCPFSRSIRLLLSELEMPFELAEEKPWEWRSTFLALNPSGDLPVLQLDDHVVLAGAYAISEYIEDMLRKAPTDERQPVPFPGNLEERAEVRRVVDWFHRKLDAEVTRELLKEKLYPRMRTDKPPQQPDPELMRAIRANLKYHMSYVSFLADQRRWLAGDVMTFADMAAAAHISVLDYLDEIKWETCPAARQWYGRMKSRPTFRALLADRITGVAPPNHYSDPDF